MIEQFRKSVQYMAHQLVEHGAKQHFTVEDLTNVGFAAIWRARAKWNPSLSSFQTYGMIKARSAMLDELRAMDHVPRLERARAKKDGRVLRTMTAGSHTPHLFDGQDRRNPLPFEAAIASDLWHSLPRLIGRRSAEVLHRYYRQDQTLKEIGRAMGISESRTCQLHAQAIDALRRRRKESIA